MAPAMGTSAPAGLPRPWRTTRMPAGSWSAKAAAALQAGDKAKAEKLARQAAAMHVSFPYWENDTPEKLLLDIGVKTTPPPAGMAKRPADPHLLVKQGQDALKAGKIEDAGRLAQQAKLVPNAKWGLFEETPEKLLDEVQKARIARDKSHSVTALAEGRKQFEQGKLDNAEKLAFQASKLHGPYGVWDFGDRPEKLLADIQTARDKARKTKLPPAPSGTGATVATNKPTAKPTSAQTPATNSGIMQASAAPVANWPAEVRTADFKGPELGPGVVTAAVVPGSMKASPILPVGGPVVPDLMPMPTAPAASMPMAVAALPPPAPMPMTPMPAPMQMGVAPAPFDPAKAMALQCMEQGKAHQTAGRYLDMPAQNLSKPRNAAGISARPRNRLTFA